jgi:hypothetical protein
MQQQILLQGFVVPAPGVYPRWHDHSQSFASYLAMNVSVTTESAGNCSVALPS